MIPKLSAPLTKLIRTGEGILLAAFNVASVTLAAVGDVAPSVALKYAAIFNAVAFASRQVLKAVAVTSPLLGGAPITPTVVEQTTEQILAGIAAAETAAAAFQAKPGVPAGQVTIGLAADPAPAAPAK